MTFLFVNSSLSWIHDSTSVLARRRTRSPISWRNIWKHGAAAGFVHCKVHGNLGNVFQIYGCLILSYFLFFRKQHWKWFEPLEPLETFFQVMTSSGTGCGEMPSDSGIAAFKALWLPWRLSQRSSKMVPWKFVGSMGRIIYFYLHDVCWFVYTVNDPFQVNVGIW